MSLGVLVLGAWGSIDGFWRSPDAHVARGNEAFRDGRYGRAVAAYQEASADLAGHPAVHFNLGAALVQEALTSEDPQERNALFEAAERELRIAAKAADPSLKGLAHYNLGNALYQQDKIQEAIDEYKSSIRMLPHHLDARWNLEVALRKQQPETWPIRALPEGGPPGSGAEPEAPNPGGEPGEEPSEPPSHGDANAKMDALERRSKDLQVGKLRSRGTLRLEGPPKDW